MKKTFGELFKGQITNLRKFSNYIVNYQDTRLLTKETFTSGRRFCIGDHIYYAMADGDKNKLKDFIVLHREEYDVLYEDANAKEETYFPVIKHKDDEIV